MYSRITAGNVQPDRIDEFMSVFKEAIVPAMKQQTGNRGGRLLTDQETGRVIAVSMWENVADLEAGEASGYLQAQVAKNIHLFIEPPVIEQYEICLRSTQPRGSYVRW